MEMFGVKGKDGFKYYKSCWYCEFDFNEYAPVDKTYPIYDNMEAVKAAGWDYDGAKWCCPQCCKEFNEMGI